MRQINDDGIAWVATTATRELFLCGSMPAYYITLTIYHSKSKSMLALPVCWHRAMYCDWRVAKWSSSLEIR